MSPDMQVIADWQRCNACLTAESLRCILQLAFPHVGVQPRDLPQGMEFYFRPYCNTARDGTLYLCQPHLRSVMQVSVPTAVSAGFVVTLQMQSWAHLLASRLLLITMAFCHTGLM